MGQQLVTNRLLQDQEEDAKGKAKSKGKKGD
jgi:hypothetical protein